MNSLYYDIITKYSDVNYNSLTESMQPKVASEVMDKVFVLTIGKYNKINFSEIERSKGDIEKLKFFKNLKESLKTLDDINTVTNELNDVRIINRALDNMVKLKSSFEKSFRIKNNCGIMIYNLVTYSIMEATSYLISSSINFVTDGDTCEIKIYENKDNVLISSLNKFNECAENGDIFKFISKAEDDMNGTSMNESILATIATFIGSAAAKKIIAGAGIALAVMVIASAVIPFLREMAYQIYRFRHKISDSAEVQAEMLELNIEILKTKDGTSKIITRQQKWVNRFRSIASKFAIDSDKAKRDANMDINRDKIEVNNIIL